MSGICGWLLQHAEGLVAAMATAIRTHAEERCKESSYPGVVLIPTTTAVPSACSATVVSFLNNNNNNKATSNVPKSLETKFRGASVQRG